MCLCTFCITVYFCFDSVIIRASVIKKMFRNWIRHSLQKTVTDGMHEFMTAQFDCELITHVTQIHIFVCIISLFHDLHIASHRNVYAYNKLGYFLLAFYNFRYLTVGQNIFKPPVHLHATIYINIYIYVTKKEPMNNYCDTDNDKKPRCTFLDPWIQELRPGVRSE